MIPVFRKIRKKMADDNKPLKYMRYAIGEIILVVIGILIALQVNTFNNKRKRIKLEEKILHEIEINLSGDIVDVQDELESFNIVMQDDSILIQHFQLKRPFNDSIGAYLHIFQMSPHLSPARSGYKLLESKGIDLISSDSLRMQITALYEISYPYYFTYADERFQMVETLIQPYLTKYFYIEKYHKWPYFKRMPMDYNLLLNDPGLISLIQTSSYHASVMSRKSVNLKSEIETLQNQIRIYLGM